MTEIPNGPTRETVVDAILGRKGDDRDGQVEADVTPEPTPLLDEGDVAPLTDPTETKGG